MKRQATLRMNPQEKKCAKFSRMLGTCRRKCKSVVPPKNRLGFLVGLFSASLVPIDHYIVLCSKITDVRKKCNHVRERLTYRCWQYCTCQFDFNISKCKIIQQNLWIWNFGGLYSNYALECVIRGLFYSHLKKLPLKCTYGPCSI